MASPTSPASTVIEPYTMHVSLRYLDLTRKKLELTRMPREASIAEFGKWAVGTPRAVLEPLIDYWLENYDWRSQEAFFNSTLRQYRTLITYHPLTESLRVHFVHHRSDRVSAIPLLYCHTWPGSFLEITRCIDALVNPVEPEPKPIQEGGIHRERVAFHVVVPSIPGFGFSDASQYPDFGAAKTADVLAVLMERLGYGRFAVWGDGWGFKIARMLVQRHESMVAAVYTSCANDLAPPQPLKSKDAWLKYQIARLTGARFSWLAFGYTSSDFGAAADTSIADDSTNHSHAKEDGIELGQNFVSGNDSQYDVETESFAFKYGFSTDSVTKRPQTLAYGFCDSPAGLLAFLLDVLKPNISHIPPPPPFMKTQTRHRSSAVLQHRMSTIIENVPEHTNFTPANVLDWVMMYWLPGPEASLRWLATVEKEDCFARYSEVPLGISWYNTNSSVQLRRQGLPHARSFEASLSSGLGSKAVGFKGSSQASTQDRPSTISPMWAAAVQNLKWVKRRKENLSNGVPAWEKSSEVVEDIKEFFELGRSKGWLGL
ncbi:uncharacterized protein PV09_01897 [Verruconis gallopava]|uniref:Epoxide hydrolase N-terminal domain-containing protein n=1 Tax=Verruconis gallopava TaxID=253628 RepID=A0A0D1Z275_9PEZI|nr:uncharacterized protein PV09_01897 [Verruconis gallopava]KIW07002.1 hypothetical protein PV09_01897 [Verruconis gallopava]